MSQHEVKSLFRRNENPNSEIEYLGGLNTDGTTWKITIEQAKQGMIEGKWDFFIVKNGRKITVSVDKSYDKIILDISGLDNLDLKDISL